MSRSPRPLPPELTGIAFSVSDVRAAALGRRRTRAADLQTPFHGTRAPAGRIDLLTACRARLSTLQSGAVISHITAARLHGLPLPPRSARAQVVHISVPVGRRAPQGRRTAGHQLQLRDGDVDERHGVPSTTPVRTFCDLATMITLAELVAVGDHLVRRGRGMVPVAELAAAVSNYSGRRATQKLRRALELVDPGAESPKESELRVVIVEAGLPRPTCNASILDPNGRFVARVDLSYVSLKIAIEYEGDHHRDKRQWRADIARRRRLEALGWTYLSVTQDDLMDPRAFLADLRAAIEHRVASLGC
jgi:hypothetical protein